MAGTWHPLPCRGTLEKVVDAFLANQTLSQSDAYNGFMKNFASEGNFFTYINPRRALLLGEKYVRSTYAPAYRNNYDSYKNIGHIGFQLAANGENIFSMIALAAEKETPGSSEQVWKFTLEDEVLGKPFIIQLPNSTACDFLVFDKSYNAYLISNAGILKWKRKLEAKPVTSVHAVDLYRDGSQQYLFATTGKIYMLDQEGKDVANYPLRLSLAPVGEMLYIDQTPEGDAQYFVSTEKARIYGYSLDGKPLPGWNPLMPDATLETPLRYFTAKGKMYFYGSTQKGSLYVWDGNGKQFKAPVQTASRFNSPFYLQYGGTLERSTFYSVDTGGNLYSIGMDGSINIKEIKEVPEPDFFAYEDTDGNSRKEFILTSENGITAFEGDSLAWRIATQESVVHPPEFFLLDGTYWIGYVAPVAGKIHLVSRSGTSYPGFPMVGNTPFLLRDVNSDGTPEVVTGGSSGALYLYRLN
ncbi:MAG: hypothetical protein M3Q97_09795 [Bacteroidota bacterium]|nr:hypothetical protein [Bacteroidota bacterium]